MSVGVHEIDVFKCNAFEICTTLTVTKPILVVCVTL